MILITYPIILIGIPTHLKHFRNHMRLQTKTWAAKLEFFIQDWKNGFSQKAPILWFWVKAYLNIYIKWSQKPLTECQHLFFPQNFVLEHCEYFFLCLTSYFLFLCYLFSSDIIILNDIYILNLTWNKLLTKFLEAFNIWCKMKIICEMV